MWHPFSALFIYIYLVLDVYKMKCRWIYESHKCSNNFKILPQLAVSVISQCNGFVLKYNNNDKNEDWR